MGGREGGREGGGRKVALNSSQSPLFFRSAPRTQTLARSDVFNMHRVLIFNYQPIRFEHK